MKQKLLTRLVLASLVGAAAVGVQAGQIQASSVSIAREVITTDTQAVTSPSISYRFAGDVDARAQAQTFQVQFILGADSGSWAALPAGIANAIQISDGVTGTIINQQAGAGGIRYVVTASGRSTDNKTLWATLTVAQDPTALIKQPIISLNVANNTIAGAAATPVLVTDRASVTGLKTVVGDLVADYAAGQVCTAVKTSRVEFRHFVALSNPSAIAPVDGTNGTADEHTRAGHTSNATLITYPTNITARFVASTGTLRLQSGGNLTFDSTGAVVLAASAAPSTPGTAHVAAPAAGQLTARLGIVQLVQNANGLDSNVTNPYRLDNTGGITNAQATALVNNGEVEAQRLEVKVTASAGFVVGGTLFTAVVGNNCAANTGGPGSTVAIVAGNAAGPITLSYTAATPGGATGADPIEICYTVPGTTLIPSSVFSGEARLVKSAAGAPFNEQDNQCNGPLYSLGGGLKIDVRNYASSKETSGYASVLRFINNSDIRTADVWAQHINQDGKLGNWAKLTDLAPRATLNMTAAQIDAKLAAGSAATSAVGTAAPTAQAGTATASDTAPRLRIVSTSGASLRVQNYLFNAATGQILEGSGSQGVDYEISGAPTTQRTGSHDQGISQDANSGLNLR